MPTPNKDRSGGATNTAGPGSRPTPDLILAELADTCGVCGRPLHAVLSRAAGLGPGCAKRLCSGDA